jgi:hypothetical protein
MAPTYMIIKRKPKNSTPKRIRIKAEKQKVNIKKKTAKTGFLTYTVKVPNKYKKKTKQIKIKEKKNIGF